MLRERLSKFKRFYYETVIKKLCRNAAVVFTVSEHSRQRLRDWLGPSDIIVAPNGVSRAFLDRRGANDVVENYFLYVGNRRPHKNIDGLLSAFSIFCKHERNKGTIQLKLTGCCDKQIAQKIRCLDIENRVEFLGVNISEDILAQTYNKALAVIIPSLDEGFGLPALEAMSLGTPVICSDKGGLGEVVGQAGLIINPHSHESIAQAMMDLTDSDTLRGVLASEGLRRSEKFSWDTSAAIVRETLDSL